MSPARTSRRLVLASASPRRRELLSTLGVRFTVLPCMLDEPRDKPRAVKPEAWAQALAYYKARAVADGLPGRWVLGADTIVVCGRRLLGKPADAADARHMLRLQAGRPCRVITGLALVRTIDDGHRGHFCWRSCTMHGSQSRGTRPARDPETVNCGLVRRFITHDVTTVWMADDAVAIEAYVRSGDWAGKAGAYGIQDVGDQLVERIAGSFSNVVGLPLERLTGLLAAMGCEL
jgi:septum formation protein